MKYDKDLTGMQFGEWKVLEHFDGSDWVCQCSCGEIRIVSRGNLTSGGSTSCGHNSKKDKLIDLTGVKVGKLTVLEYVKEKNMWLCKCECGETCYKRSYDIRHNKAKTCGKCKNVSHRFIDITNQKFGELTAIKYLGDGQWLCKCSCGKDKIVKTTALRNGSVVSCGHTLNQQKVINIKNEIFGKLRAIEYVGGSKWRCLCECGNERIVSTSELRSGKVKQCRECTENSVRLKYDLTGMRFGDIEVLRYERKLNKWLCKCNRCGNLKYIYGQHLRVGDTVTCECTHREITLEEIISTVNRLTEDLDRKPFAYEIAEIIDCSESTIRSKLKDNNLQNLLGVDTRSSRYEDELAEIIESVSGYKVDRHYKLDNTEIDIYIPELKTGFEFNGNYWHSTMHKEMMFHQQKTLICARKNIRLIHIFEYEWLNSKYRDKIETYLINLLGRDKQILHGRDTYIKEVTTQEEKEFLNTYHLQGYTPSSIKIGMYIKDTDILVGLMTFGKPRFNKGIEFELIRLAYKSMYVITGGMEKMFSYFVEKYNPKSIISYCNLAKFYGNSYLKLGFEAVNLTNPNYVWVEHRSKVVLSRYQTQKQLLIENGIGTNDMTEDEIMESLHYLKVYDSGNIKLLWNN